MADITITLTLKASPAALPKDFVLDAGASAVSKFDMKKLTLRGTVGKRVRVHTVKLVEAK